MILNKSFAGISCLVLATCLAPPVTFADVLTQLNGEVLVGKVVQENTNQIVFESDTFGRLTVPRSRIRQLQRTPPPKTGDTNQVPAVVPDSGLSTNSTFVISGLGKDGFDWLQLKTAEWLKGRLRDIRNDKVKFESEKLEDLTFKLSDVRYLYCANPMFIKFQGQDQIYGTVVVSNNLVQVVAAEQIQLPREQLTGITPAGKHELDLWSFKMSAGVNFQAGNTKQTTVNTSAEVTRRTPATQFLLNYLGNFSEVEGEQNANNHRINLSYDVRLSRNWFLRPVQAEYYRDQLANIAHRATAGIGLGYYILDSEGLEWKVAAGPGYQYTRFSTVEPGTSDSASTPAAFLQSEFEADITSRLTLIQTFSSTLASDEAGLYSHHWVTTLEFELKKSLDLNLSFVWDYLQNPRIEASGVVPQRSDLRLTLGLGVKF